MRAMGSEQWRESTNGAFRSAHLHSRTTSLESVRLYSLPCLVYFIVLDPNDPRSMLFVASLFEDQPVFVDISGITPIKRHLPSAPKRPLAEGEDLNERTAAQDAKQNTCVTIFNSLGTHVIAGTSKGWLNVIDLENLSVIHSTRLCSGLIILLRLSASGREVVSNSSDRVIRTLRLPDLSHDQIHVDDIRIEVEHKFQDVVNRLAWNHVTFSSTGDYVAATTYMNHDIYVWERGHGSLTKILEGPKEELGVVEVRILRSKGSRYLTKVISSGTLIAPSSRHVDWKRAASTCGP